MTLNVSLTQSLLIDPILMQREKANHSFFISNQSSQIKNKFAANVICRIAALFASITCLLDSLYHVKEILRKSSCLLLRKCNRIDPLDWCTSDIKEHFKRAIFFTSMIFISSLAGFIYPEFFYFFTFSPQSRGDVLECAKLESAIKLAPESIQLLIKRNLENLDIDDVTKFFEKGALQESYHLVQILNFKHPSFKTLRENCGKKNYKHPDSSKREGPFWMAPSELQSLKPLSALHEAAFFYSVPTTALLPLLTSGQVQVSYNHFINRQLCKGAFVSHKLMASQNTCTLIFRSNIERLSSLTHGYYSRNDNVYWAGFSQPIPITNATLVGIVIQSINDQDEVEKAKRLTQMAKGFAKDLKSASINFYEFEQAQALINQSRGLTQGMGIPTEWP